MLGWVRVFPLLGVALAATIPPTPKDIWSLQDVVDLYNKGTRYDYLCRLVETAASNVLARPGRIQFTVKETECLKSEIKNINDCPFKEDGVMKACTAFLPVDPKTDEIVINCDSPGSKRSRVRRARPWNCYRRGGCYSIIGKHAPGDTFEESLELDSGVIGSDDSDLDRKDIPRGQNIVKGDTTQSQESSNPSEFDWSWDEQDAK